MNNKENITVNNFKFQNLRPLKKKFINKNNKFSAKACINNKEVKIYEVFDQNQGELREFVSNHHKLSKFFPKLITYNEKYIVEQWVYGPTLKEIDYKNIDQSNEVKKFINLMWSIKYHKEVFDYIGYIHNRVEKKNNFNFKNIPLRINHNDLSLDNIILTDKGLKIIDNEFLGYNTGWILNFRNSFLDDNYESQNFFSEENIKKLWEIRMEWSRLKNDHQNKIFSFFNYIKKYLFKFIN